MEGDLEEDRLSAAFSLRLPSSRLGRSHETLGSFRTSIMGFQATEEKHYTLIVVMTSGAPPNRRRILLGRKHRGFGAGLYNSFGGKVEPGETLEESARRELEEETQISIPLSSMKEARIGTLFFTFADSPTEMIVHLFRVIINIDDAGGDTTKFHYVDPNVIRGCDEITPYWFDPAEMPLDRMFADDSVWLTRLLAWGIDDAVLLDGWFHFEAGGVEVNTILDYYLFLRSPSEGELEKRDAKEQPLTLEKRLFHELHQRKINSPTLKEFNEAYAFCGALRIKSGVDIVLDVAGGHGALAMLFLITIATASTAVVIDPADVGGRGVERAWGKHLNGKELRYRHECLRTGLPAELDNAIARGIARSRILVVACHACQHLSDEILQIACRYGVQVAVMPCCQRDSSPGCAWKAASKNLGIPIAHAMDLLLAGKAMSWNVGNAADVTYDVRMKVINHKITPHNRVILCRPKSTSHHNEVVERAHAKLKMAYKRAHNDDCWLQKTQSTATAYHNNWPLPVTLGLGFALGAVTAMVVMKRSS